MRVGQARRLSYYRVTAERGPERRTELKRKVKELTQLVNGVTWKRNGVER
jgi:hypothetical protein